MFDIAYLQDLTLNLIYATSIVLIITTIISIYFVKKFANIQKNVFFWTNTILVIISTIVLVGSTLYLNAVSPTHGPVHWHADYEILVCNEKLELIDPTGFMNRVGTPVLHEHNDNRIHVEGTPIDIDSISLGSFFSVVGGEFTRSSLAIPTNSGIRRVKNGDNCNGGPGKLYLFVEVQEGSQRAWYEEDSMDIYVLSGYSTIPPGDKLKIIFSDRDAIALLADIQAGRL